MMHLLLELVKMDKSSMLLFCLFVCYCGATVKAQTIENSKKVCHVSFKLLKV